MSEDSTPPHGWVRTTLGDVLHIVRGVTYDKSESSKEPGDGRIPVLRATNIGELLDFDDLVYVPPKCVSEEQLLRIGDIVIAASSGSLSVVGKAARLASDWYGSFGAFCMGLRVNPPIESAYVAHFLGTSEYRHGVSNLAAGSNINNLRRSHIESFSCPLAPLPEQRRIVAKIEELFSDLDAGVAALKRVQAKLKRYRASVLKAAVEGRLTEEWRKQHPDVEPADQLLARILAERRDKWEADQLTKFAAAGKQPPKGWKEKYEQPQAPSDVRVYSVPPTWSWATVNQCSIKIDYGTSSKTSEDDAGIAVLRMGNIESDGRLNLASLKYLPTTHDEFPALLLSTGDLLFNRTNSAELVGKSAVYRGMPTTCSFASYLIRIRLLSHVLPDIVAFTLNGAFGRMWIKTVVNQTAGQANVNGSKLAAFEFPLPPAIEQVEIVAEVDRRLSVVDAIESEVDHALQRAARLRQSILKRAFEGKLVPQDPTDEPASKLLERLRAAATPSAVPTSPKPARKPRQPRTAKSGAAR